jgi:hypothetical protein
MLLLLKDLSRLTEVLTLERLLGLADHLLLLESSLLLLVKHPPKLNDLVLLNGGLIFKHLSELLLVALEPLSVLLHF